MSEDIIVREGKTIRFDYFIFLLFKKHYISNTNIVQAADSCDENPSKQDGLFIKRFKPRQNLFV